MSGTLPDAKSFLLKDEVCPRCLGSRDSPGYHACPPEIEPAQMSNRTEPSLLRRYLQSQRPAHLDPEAVVPVSFRATDADAEDAKMEAAERLARMILDMDVLPVPMLTIDTAEVRQEHVLALRAEARAVLGE